jgi:hypothetical protein
MAQHGSGQQSGASKSSWLDRALDTLKPEPGAPPRPHAPSAHGNRAWDESVEQHHVLPGLTVHDVGLSVFGETRSLHDRPGSNEPIGSARQKIAHAMINDAELSRRTGKHRNTVHDPVEPSDRALRNPQERAAYESSLRAAREAYLNGYDPTNGAIYFNLNGTPTRANKVYQGGSAKGVPISTQSGPYHNSFPTKIVPSLTWVGTYSPDEHDKKMRKNH